MAKKTITVVTNEENPEPVEIIAQAIIDIDAAFKKVRESRLTRRALVVLIHDRCRLPQKDINAVLDSVEFLKSAYTKELPKRSSPPHQKN